MNINELTSSLSEIAHEYAQLQRFKEQMLKMQPFKVGDKVRLTAEVLHIDYDKAFGWRGAKGILRPNNSGTIADVQWNEYSNDGKGSWQVAWKPDLEWSLSVIHNEEFVFIRHPGRRHIYYMPYRYVSHIESNDHARVILPPPNCDRYEVVDAPRESDGSPIARYEVTYQEIVEHRWAKVKVPDAVRD